MRLVFGCKSTALWILVAVKHTQNKTLGILFKQWNLNATCSGLMMARLTATNIHLRNTHWDVPPERCTVVDTV